MSRSIDKVGYRVIRDLSFENFLNFKKFNAEFAGINLIVGENDTGKTGLLKLLYAISKTWEIYSRQQSRSAFKKVLGQKLFDTFQPRNNGIGDLVTKAAKEKFKLSINFAYESVAQEIRFGFGESTKNSISKCTEHVKSVGEAYNAIFIPAKEVFTALHAIKFTRDPSFLFGFDDTYFDLVKQLEIPAIPHPNKKMVAVSQPLDVLFGGTIILSPKKENFIFKRGNQEFAMPLTAEGIKRVGLLSTLIKNRQLRTGAVLFLDEPETALHPKAIRLLVEMIIRIAQAGVQVFMSTHDYFVINQLSISAKRENTSIFCFSLSKNADGYIDNLVSDLRKGMPSNPIVDEALNMFDEEIKLDLGL